MNLNEFHNRWEDLTPDARKKYLEKFFGRVVGDPEQYEDFIRDCLCTASDYEQDDYFGTEGFQF